MPGLNESFYFSQHTNLRFKTIIYMQPCRTTDRQQHYWMEDQALKDDA